MKKNSIRTKAAWIAGAAVALVFGCGAQLRAGNDQNASNSSNGSQGWSDHLVGMQGKGSEIQWFAHNFILVDLGQNDKDGELFATIADKRSQEKMIVSNKPNKRGLRLASINWACEALLTTVTIKMGELSAVIKFDPALLGAPSQNQPAEAAPLARSFGALTPAQVDGLRQQRIRHDDSIETDPPHQ